MEEKEKKQPLGMAIRDRLKGDGRWPRRPGRLGMKKKTVPSFVSQPPEPMMALLQSTVRATEMQCTIARLRKGEQEKGRGKRD